MKRVLIILAALLIVLTACAPASTGENAVSDISNDGIFEISIYTDKDVYSKSEPILCWAVVEYVGKDERIQIYSSDPLVGFGLKDGKYFDGTYVAEDVLITTEFIKGEPETYEFAKSGGWSAGDPNASFYEQFYADDELILPSGEYEISATVNGFFDQNDYKGSKYELKASVKVNVE